MVPVTDTKKTGARLECLLRPRSIALIGASATPGSLGESVLLNLESASFSGEVYLVNPKRPVIHGQTAFVSIEELPDGIDCAVLAIPGRAVLEAAASCAHKNFGSVIVFSAGFAESGEEGKAAQRELARLAREHDMVIEGPNCLGIVNYTDAIPLTFVSTPPQARGKKQSATILSQSGALAAVVAVNMRHHGIQLSYSISTGNEAAYGIEDFLEYLIEEAGTRVFALIVEQFRKPRRFLALARRARQMGKYIVLLHPGSSKEARASAATHTGALAEDYEVMRTLVTHAGVVHVETLEELVDVTQILTSVRELPRSGAAVFTESGAFKALTLDLCDRIGLALPPLSVAADKTLREALPPFIPPSNPLDLTAQALVDPTLYRRTLPAVLQDEQFGSVVLAIILTDPATTALKLPPILDAIRSLRPEKPVLFAALDEGAPFDATGIEELRDLGLPCFPSPERALRALSHVTSLGQRALPTEPDRVPPRTDLRLREGIHAEYRAKSILQAFGIPVPAGKLAQNPDEAAGIAKAIGYPVALKVQAVDLPHKTEAGGVILGIDDESALRMGWTALEKNIAVSQPGLVPDGILVERMGSKGLELIFGARNDQSWGPVLLAGSGGVLAEAMRDVHLMPPDLSPAELASELGKLQCAPLLHGFRGAPPADIESAAQILAALSALIRSHPEIEEVDINPVVVFPEGAGAMALDALIRVGQGTRQA